MKRLIPVIVAASMLCACSVQKMAGDAVIEYTHDKAIPYLMSQGDLQSACSMGQSMGPVVASFAKVELDPSNVGIATNMASGMCAEFEQRDAELDRVRAIFENRTTAAQDALIREKQGHRLAAIRMVAGYENAMQTFGNFSENAVPMTTIPTSCFLCSALQAVHLPFFTILTAKNRSVFHSMSPALSKNR